MLQGGVYGNMNPKRLQGKTMIVSESKEPDPELYGGGRKGAKAYETLFAYSILILIIYRIMKQKLNQIEVIVVDVHMYVLYYRDWGNGNDDDDDDGAKRERQANDEEREKRARNRFIMDEFKKRKV